MSPKAIIITATIAIASTVAVRMRARTVSVTEAVATARRVGPNYVNAVITNYSGIVTNLRSSKYNNSRSAGVSSNRSKIGAV